VPAWDAAQPERFSTANPTGTPLGSGASVWTFWIVPFIPLSWFSSAHRTGRCVDSALRMHEKPSTFEEFLAMAPRRWGPA